MRFLDEMYQAAEESAPGEMCGLVIRQNDTEKWILCQNISEDKNDFEIDAKVLISELSGSESLIHFTNGNLNWVSLSNGIQQKNIGEDAKLHMNIDEFLYFDQNNRLVNHG